MSRNIAYCIKKNLQHKSIFIHISKEIIIFDNNTFRLADFGVKKSGQYGGKGRGMSDEVLGSKNCIVGFSSTKTEEFAYVWDVHGF